MLIAYVVQTKRWYKKGCSPLHFPSSILHTIPSRDGEHVQPFAICLSRPPNVARCSSLWTRYPRGTSYSQGGGSELVSKAELFPRGADTLTVKAPPSSSFFLNSLKGQRPTTRHYNFVVSEMSGAPDGFTKPMLVVNGM